ncbi:hypothetical protein [Niveibacterium sp.]|uniref:hypothetical protein n=1 Tax=Niveibacterium sp. TaxID=2017444 RepID=UPI0035AFF300
MEKKNARLTEAKPSASDSAIFTSACDAIKADLEAGKAVQLIDFDAERRPFAVAAIAKLRDELPIRCGWHTIRESHLSETRLRAKRYSIDGTHLNKGGAQ